VVQKVSHYQNISNFDTFDFDGWPVKPANDISFFLRLMLYYTILYYIITKW